MTDAERPDPQNPLTDLEHWDDDLRRRYPEPASAPRRSRFTDPGKKKEDFRNYAAEARESVREFYRLNHRYQTVDLVQDECFR